MPRETMSPRERWLAVLKGEKPDRIPMDYWGTDEATAKVMKHLGCSDPWEMYERLHIDKVVTVIPEYAGPPLEPGCDKYGCSYEMVDYGTGAYSECVEHPLARFGSVDEIESAYTWPTADWLDFSGIPAQIEGREHHPVHGGGSEPFLTYCAMRGMEQAFVDLIDKPDMVHHCLGRLFALRREVTRRIFEQLPGRVDLCYIAEDFGTQQGLLMSAQTIREFFLPQMKRMMDLAHKGGARVFFHSDGAVREIIPDMIEAGIDILNPIQWRCPGMDRAGLKRDFGGKVVFHGGVDNQETLPFGTVDDVRAEVAANIDILGHGGGYILAPCHNVQAVSPPENIVALYEAGLEFGWY